MTWVLVILTIYAGSVREVYRSDVPYTDYYDCAAERGRIKDNALDGEWTVLAICEAQQ